MIGNLIYKKALYSTQSFMQGHNYLYLGDNDEYKSCGNYIGDEGHVVVANNNNFEKSHVVISIKNVVCVYVEKGVTMTVGKEYSVYKITSAKYNNVCNYAVVNDSYEYEEYPAYCFMTKEEYLEIKNHPNFKWVIEKKVLSAKYDEDADYSKEHIKKILDAVNERSSKLIYKSVVSKKSTKKSLLKRMVLAARGIDSVDLNNRFLLDKGMALEKINTLPLEMLGKIKIVENNIEILDVIGVSKEIIALVSESINLTLALLDYNHNEDTILKIHEFLNNTITYCNTLRNNKNIEQSYIANKLANNINSAIENNNILFEQMIEDGDILQKHLK